MTPGARHHAGVLEPHSPLSPCLSQPVLKPNPSVLACSFLNDLVHHVNVVATLADETTVSAAAAASDAVNTAAEVTRSQPSPFDFLAVLFENVLEVGAGRKSSITHSEQPSSAGTDAARSDPGYSPSAMHQPHHCSSSQELNVYTYVTHTHRCSTTF